MMPNLLPVSPNGLYPGGIGPAAYQPHPMQINPLYGYNYELMIQQQHQHQQAAQMLLQAKQ